MSILAFWKVLQLHIHPQVSRMAGVEMGKDVFEALEVNRYCVTAAVDFLLSDISGR